MEALCQLYVFSLWSFFLKLKAGVGETRHDAVCSGSLTGKIRPIIQSCTSVINIY